MLPFDGETRQPTKTCGAQNDKKDLTGINKEAIRDLTVKALICKPVLHSENRLIPHPFLSPV
jgi:hypothetical protein